MKSFNIKNILTIVIIASLSFYIYMNNESSINNRRLEDLRKECDSLTSVNELLLFDVTALKDSIKINQQQIDSLSKEKNKIVIKYKTKINEIDKFNSVQLVNEFDSIFSSANIK